MAIEENNQGPHKITNTAKTLATVALIIALLALGWAIKADMRAGDAWDKANQTPNSLQEGE